jgi:glycosyltransferase involved in cell wall biosynthesis
MIAHLTTVHPRGDTRIRIKETASLAENLNSSVALFIQDGQGDEQSSGGSVQIVDTGARSQGRLARMTHGAWRMYRALRRARPRVGHFHDPELIPVGLALKLSGVKVIYDVHEDLPRQILGKHWLSPWLRRPVSWVAEAVEWVAGRVFDGIVAATPTIARRFPAGKTVTVQNFPILSELVPPDPVPYAQRRPHFAYVGGITGIRGAREMVEAIGRVRDDSIRLQLAGNFSNSRDEKAVRSIDGWTRVDFHGWASRPDVARLLGNVRAGLVLFHPLPNHLDAQPNKMFEYMVAGLPVIASNFPLWREIVAGAACGLLVDPLNPGVIAEAMQWLLDHPAEAEAMGRRGRQAVEETYNWEPEAGKLIGLYRRILGEDTLKKEMGKMA